MKVSNPSPTQEFHANIYGEWYSIPAGESIDVTDAAVASTLVEYGAVANPLDVEAAHAATAAANRQINSASASASASEGAILQRQQATVDPISGGVDGGPLKGAALDAAVKAANDAGANIDPKGKADDRRDAIAAFQSSHGSSSPVSIEEFLVGPDGNLVLDGDGQPIDAKTEAYLRDDEGRVLFDEDGSPKAVPQDESDASDPDSGEGHSDLGDGNA